MVRRQDQKRDKSKVRYAVVGLGYISQAALLPAFQHASENSQLAALVSSDSEKLTKLGRKYGVSKLYGYEEYGDCLKSGQVDAVYIGLPNHMHRAYAVAAAEAGVHILCEKPMALDEADCEAMIEAVGNASVKLMIAYRLHLEAGNLEMIKLIHSGKIGDPRVFSSVFSQQVKAGNSRLEKSVGGGSIYDMGIYCINAARYLFKAEPTEVFAWNLNSGDERFSEVPEMTGAMMRFPNDRMAQFTSSFGAADRSNYEVVGTKGTIRMEPAYDMTGDFKAQITLGNRKKHRVFKSRDQFAAELVYFSGCILDNKQPEPSGQEGLADVRIIEGMLKSATTNRPVIVEQAHKLRHPGPQMAIERPPLAKTPALVKAATPGA
jgi:glucose-fructose oxidoreductase